MLHEQSYSTFKSKRADLINSSTMLQTPGVVLISVGFFAGVAELVFFGGTGLILLIAGGIKANLRSCSECRGQVKNVAELCPHCATQFSSDEWSTASGRSAQRASSVTNRRTLNQKSLESIRDGLANPLGIGVWRDSVVNHLPDAQLDRGSARCIAKQPPFGTSAVMKSIAANPV